MASEHRGQTGVSIAGVVLVLLGVLFLLQTTEVVSWRVWVHLLRFWPVLLIVIGLNVWFGGKRPMLAAGAIAVTLVALAGTAIAVEASEEPDAGTGSGALSIDSIFGSASRTIRGEPFDGGEANAVFGSVELDLREAVHPGGELSLELNAIFGSVELRVPRDWDVRIDGTPVMGSVEDRRLTPDLGADPPVLNVNASAVFGSVMVRN